MEITIGKFTQQDVIIYCTLTAVISIVIGIVLGFVVGRSTSHD